MNEMLVTKNSGEKVAFSAKKLENSLRRSGASTEQISAVMKALSEQLYDQMSTKKIYALAYRILKSKARPVAARYHLKRGLMELGPSGFPFEQYVSQLLSSEEWKTETGQIIQGVCVRHEVDVIARKDSTVMLVECKYHNLPGTFCDVKVPLYIHSRFRDIATRWEQEQRQNKKQDYKSAIFTNTRFSTDAISYGICAGIRLVSWDFPSKGSLRDIIDSRGLYPVTCLTTLSKSEKQKLLAMNIVLCNSLHTKPELLHATGVSKERLPQIQKEILQLTNQNS
jgi:hypothetical protein